MKGIIKAALMFYALIGFLLPSCDVSKVLDYMPDRPVATRTATLESGDASQYFSHDADTLVYDRVDVEIGGVEYVITEGTIMTDAGIAAVVANNVTITIAAMGFDTLVYAFD